MDARLISLKLVLDALGVEWAIRKLSDRKLLQKAIYLAQLSGADLGYSYGWYKRGPYSPKLTRDYYGLDEALDEDDAELSRYTLVPQVAQRLDTVRPLMAVPAGIDLEQHDWLELLASLHFLLVNRRLPIDAARGVLAEEKPHLVDYIDHAYRVLHERELVAA